MKAKIIKIEKDAVLESQSGTYDGIRVTYQGEPYQGKTKDPTERFLFGNSDIANEFLKFKEGDWVDIDFQKNGKHSNPVAVRAADAPSEGKPKSPASGSGTKTSSGGGYNDPDRQTSIVRQSCLNRATDLVAVMAANGGYSAANLKKREFLVNEILQTAKALEAYANLKETEESVETPPFDTTEGDEQEKFDG